MGMEMVAGGGDGDHSPVMVMEMGMAGDGLEMTNMAVKKMTTRWIIVIPNEMVMVMVNLKYTNYRHRCKRCVWQCL